MEPSEPSIRFCNPRQPNLVRYHSATTFFMARPLTVVRPPRGDPTCSARLIRRPRHARRTRSPFIIVARLRITSARRGRGCGGADRLLPHHEARGGSHGRPPEVVIRPDLVDAGGILASELQLEDGRSGRTVAALPVTTALLDFGTLKLSLTLNSGFAHCSRRPCSLLACAALDDIAVQRPSNR
jgi:hypothetical protein